MAINFIELRRMVPGDRLYAPMNDFHIIVSGILHAASLMTDGSTHKTVQPAMRVETTQYDYVFVLSLRGALEYALANTKPPFIEIGTSFVPEQIGGKKTSSMGLKSIMVHIISPIFIFFFERYNEWLTDTYGDDENWPSTLNFARVIRNAAAHGSIHFRNPRAKPVSWRNLSFGPADNGKKIIGNEIIVGDIIGLMFEANAELDGLKAPIL